MSSALFRREITGLAGMEEWILLRASPESLQLHVASADGAEGNVFLPSGMVDTSEKSIISIIVTNCGEMTK